MSDQSDALTVAAADSAEVREFLKSADPDELAWAIEDTEAPDDDPTPPDPAAVAWRDKWLAEKVKAMVKPYKG